jgi:hypothetical protein
MDNYTCDFSINDYDITIHFKCNDQNVYSFLTDFKTFYEGFVLIFDKKAKHQIFEFLNSNGVIQITLINQYLSFELSRYGSDVYADSVFRIKLTDKFDKLILDIKNKNKNKK